MLDDQVEVVEYTGLLTGETHCKNALVLVPLGAEHTHLEEVVLQRFLESVCCEAKYVAPFEGAETYRRIGIFFGSCLYLHEVSPGCNQEDHSTT